jgi:hypothetical protein
VSLFAHLVNEYGGVTKNDYPSAAPEVIPVCGIRFVQSLVCRVAKCLTKHCLSFLFFWPFYCLSVYFVELLLENRFISIDSFNKTKV